jgi:hypothetical protein
MNGLPKPTGNYGDIGVNTRGYGSPLIFQLATLEKFCNGYTSSFLLVKSAELTNDFIETVSDYFEMTLELQIKKIKHHKQS